MLVSTPGFQQTMIKFIGNVGRHTRISAENYKKDMGNIGRHIKI